MSKFPNKINLSKMLLNSKYTIFATIIILIKWYSFYGKTIYNRYINFI